MNPKSSLRIFGSAGSWYRDGPEETSGTAIGKSVVGVAGAGIPVPRRRSGEEGRGKARRPGRASWNQIPSSLRLTGCRRRPRAAAFIWRTLSLLMSSFSAISDKVWIVSQPIP